MTLDLQKFKERLEQEKKDMESSLSEIARVNPANPNDWETTPVPAEGNPEMRDELADFLEDLGEREATETELEQRLTSITRALERIDAGTYGLCHICHNPIETERLEASPVATTCKTHLNQK